MLCLHFLKHVKIRGFPFHLRHIPFKLSVFHRWKIHWKKIWIQGADFLSSWVRDQAMTERHARRNLDACSKRLERNLEVWTLGRIAFPPKNPLRWTPNFASMHPLQSDRLCVCNWAVHAPVKGRKLDGQKNQRPLTFRTACRLQPNASHLC